LDIGPGELLVVLVIVLLLFGSKKIPELARSIGQAIHELRAGASESSEGGDRDLTPRTGPAAGGGGA
jgi:sec-independent protein translocase protein TatA